MHLFSKNTLTAHDSIRTCPSCSAELNIKQYPTVYCLNGIPNNITSQLEHIVICEKCSAPIITTCTPSNHSTSWHPPKEYTAILSNMATTMSEKKLAIMELYNLALFPLWYAQYYHETGDKLQEEKWLRLALEDTLNGKDANTMTRIRCQDMPQLKMKGDYVIIGAVERQIDIYRRLQMWDEAQQLLSKHLEKFKTITLSAAYKWLQAEQKLISAHNSAPQ